MLPVFVPEVAPADAGDEYPTQACSTGKFALKAAMRSSARRRCIRLRLPRGDAVQRGELLSRSYTDLAVDEFNCVNARTNNSVFTAGKDGRVFNKWVRKANGALVVDKAGRVEINAYYRVRTAACDEISSTLNIGCLAGNYACTLGFAGREAVETAGLNSKALAIKGVFPTVTDIRKLISGDPTVYPLARSLYVNTQVGFENVTDTQEAALATCFADQAQADAAANSAGFVTLGQAPVLARTSTKLVVTVTCSPATRTRIAASWARAFASVATPATPALEGHVRSDLHGAFGLPAAWPYLRSPAVATTPATTTPASEASTISCCGAA